MIHLILEHVLHELNNSLSYIIVIYTYVAHNETASYIQEIMQLFLCIHNYVCTVHTVLYILYTEVPLPAI